MQPDHAHARLQWLKTSNCGISCHNWLASRCSINSFIAETKSVTTATSTCLANAVRRLAQTALRNHDWLRKCNHGRPFDLLKSCLKFILFGWDQHCISWSFKNMQWRLTTVWLASYDQLWLHLCFCIFVCIHYATHCVKSFLCWSVRISLILYNDDKSTQLVIWEVYICIVYLVIFGHS